MSGSSLLKQNDHFFAHRDETLEIIQGIKGHLTGREARCLFTLGYFPTTEGQVVEIGSYMGKSTVLLAKAIQLSGSHSTLYAVDPLTSPSITDPTILVGEDVSKTFYSNLESNGVSDQVEFLQGLSADLAKTWDRDIRLLWIDGDHTYRGVRLDLELFKPYLREGAVVAFHDVLNSFEGPVRIFAEDIVLNPDFKGCSLCGSIGYAQYLPSDPLSDSEKSEKLDLYKRLSGLIPMVAFDRDPQGFEKKVWKWKRSRVPRKERTVEEMLSELVIFSKRE